MELVQGKGNFKEINPTPRTYCPEKQRKQLLAKVHIARVDLKWSDDFYRDQLEMLFNVHSAAALNLRQLGFLLEFFKKVGWKPKPSKRKQSPSNEDYQTLALRRRAREMAGQIGNGEKRLDGLVKKLCGVDNLDWCDDENKLKRLLAALGTYYRKERDNAGK